MHYGRPYVVEGDLPFGCAVTRGTNENNVTIPTAADAAFIGVYCATRNQYNAGEGDHVSITVGGLAKARVSGDCVAGQPAMAEVNTGALVSIPTAAGEYRVVAVFLEDGADGELVDVWIERERVTVGP